MACFPPGGPRVDLPVWLAHRGGLIGPALTHACLFVIACVNLLQAASFMRDLVWLHVFSPRLLLTLA